LVHGALIQINRGRFVRQRGKFAVVRALGARRLRARNANQGKNESPKEQEGSFYSLPPHEDFSHGLSPY